MPLFEFHCDDCEHEFETLVRSNETVRCPACESARLQKLMSAASARVTGNSSLPMAPDTCPPPEAGPCSPHCCRLPQ